VVVRERWDSALGSVRSSIFESDIADCCRYRHGRRICFAELVVLIYARDSPLRVLIHALTSPFSHWIIYAPAPARLLAQLFLCASRRVGESVQLLYPAYLASPGFDRLKGIASLALVLNIEADEAEVATS
jgi:hypothetical protein